MNENDENMSRDQIAAGLLTIADQIENQPNAREAIATGFRLVALAMSPCEDCGRQVAPVIHPDDNPETGADLVDTAAGKVA